MRLWYQFPMRTIPHMHDFFSGLPEPVKEEWERLSNVRKLGKSETVYHRGDQPTELYRLLEGAVKLCNYSLDGGEVVAGELRTGDCFGEMGLIDGLPRVSHAVASMESRISVLSAQNFSMLRDKYREIDRQLSLILCRRVRFLYSLYDDAVGLKLHERLARVIHRLAYSHGHQREQHETYIEISHEELSKMLGASRQSVSKELKALERDGDIKLRYGRIYVCDLGLLGDKYERDIGVEQYSAFYDENS